MLVFRNFEVEVNEGDGVLSHCPKGTFVRKSSILPAVSRLFLMQTFCGESFFIQPA